MGNQPRPGVPPPVPPRAGDCPGATLGAAGPCTPEWLFASWRPGAALPPGSFWGVPSHNRAPGGVSWGGPAWARGEPEALLWLEGSGRSGVHLHSQLDLELGGSLPTPPPRAGLNSLALSGRFPTYPGRPLGGYNRRHAGSPPLGLRGKLNPGDRGAAPRVTDPSWLPLLLAYSVVTAFPHAGEAPSRMTSAWETSLRPPPGAARLQILPPWWWWCGVLAAEEAGMGRGFWG